jgi:hypothetical protein
VRYQSSEYIGIQTTQNLDKCKISICDRLKLQIVQCRIKMNLEVLKVCQKKKKK